MLTYAQSRKSQVAPPPAMAGGVIFLLWSVASGAAAVDFFDAPSMAADPGLSDMRPEDVSSMVSKEKSHWQ